MDFMYYQNTGKKKMRFDSYHLTEMFYDNDCQKMFFANLVKMSVPEKFCRTSRQNIYIHVIKEEVSL